MHPSKDPAPTNWTSGRHSPPATPAPLIPAPWLASLSSFVSQIAALAPGSYPDQKLPFPQTRTIRGQLHDRAFMTVIVADLIKALTFCGSIRGRATKPVVPVMCSARDVAATADPKILAILEKLALRAHPITGGGPGLMETTTRLDFMARLADLTCAFVKRYPERVPKLITALMKETTLSDRALIDFCTANAILPSSPALSSRAEILDLLNQTAASSHRAKEGRELLALHLAMNSSHEMPSFRDLLRSSCGLNNSHIDALGLQVFAIKIRIANEAIISRYISSTTELNYFVGRKIPFAKEAFGGEVNRKDEKSKVALVLPGGYGTYEELAELLQQGVHVVIYGEVWQQLVERFQSSPNPELRAASNQFLHYCETPEKVEAAFDLYLPNTPLAPRKPGERCFEDTYGKQARDLMADLLGSEEEILAMARTLEDQCLVELSRDPETIRAMTDSGQNAANYLATQHGVIGPATAEAVSQALYKKHLSEDASANWRAAHRIASKAGALRLVSKERAELLASLEPDTDGEHGLDLRFLTWAVADMAVASSIPALVPARDGIAIIGSRTSYSTYLAEEADPLLTIEAQRKRVQLVEDFGRAFGGFNNTFVIPNTRPDSVPACFIRAVIEARTEQSLTEHPNFVEINSASNDEGSTDRAVALVPHPQVAVRSHFGKELAITKSTMGALLFEGGINTEAFLIEVLDGIATGKIPKSYKIVLVGTDWGNRVKACIEPLIAAQTADAFVRDLIIVTEDPSVAIAAFGLEAPARVV